MRERCEILRGPRSDMWFESEGFVKAKQDRVYENTTVPQARILGNCPEVNAAVKPPPPGWRRDAPTQLEMMMSIPLGTKHWVPFDIEHAFASMLLENSVPFNPA